MTPITQRDILAHQQQVPWPNLRQVEQDLLLCRAMTALFEGCVFENTSCHARWDVAPQGSSCSGIKV